MEGKGRFLNSNAYQRPEDPVTVAGGGCRNQSSEEGEPSSPVGGVVVTRGSGQPHYFLCILWNDPGTAAEVQGKAG